MSKKLEDLELRRLRKLIKEYLAEGFDVFAESKKYPKPEVIEGFIPDLVAKKGDQTIIIEVVSNPNLKKLSQKMKVLSKYAEANDKVRFDIVLTNPKPRLDRREKNLSNQVLLTDVQQRLFDTSIESYKHGEYNACLLLLNILLENILRLYAIENKIINIKKEMHTNNVAYLLLNKKKISEANYNSIIQLVKTRQNVVHDRYSLEKEVIREYIDFVSFFIKKIVPKVRVKGKNKLNNEYIHFT